MVKVLVDSEREGSKNEQIRTRVVEGVEKLLVEIVRTAVDAGKRTRNWHFEFEVERRKREKEVARSKRKRGG